MTLRAISLTTLMELLLSVGSYKSPILTTHNQQIFSEQQLKVRPCGKY